MSRLSSRDLDDSRRELGVGASRMPASDVTFYSLNCGVMKAGSIHSDLSRTGFHPPVLCQGIELIIYLEKSLVPEDRGKLVLSSGWKSVVLESLQEASW